MNQKISSESSHMAMMISSATSLRKVDWCRRVQILIQFAERHKISQAILSKALLIINSI